MTLEPDDMDKIENVIKKIADEISDQTTVKIEAAVIKKIDERFTAFGFDIKAPIEIQKDQAWAHSARITCEKVANKMVMLFLATLIGIFALLKFILPTKG